MLLSVSHDESLPADPTHPRSAVQSAWCQHIPPKNKFFLCSLAYGKGKLHTLSFKNSVSLMTLYLKILILPSSNLIFLSKYHETQNSSILPQTFEGTRATPTFKLCCRYKFLAFDFDETVDVTKDNSRLLLVRLKMEGWATGKSKVFLKYYHVEYLAR